MAEFVKLLNILYPKNLQKKDERQKIYCEEIMQMHTLVNLKHPRVRPIL